MVRGNKLREYLARRTVKYCTMIGSFIAFIGAIITWLMGEEPLFVIILLGVGIIFGILRLIADK
ncbi:MAG: hypothetical protein ACTSWA_10830 [Candidatus Thorarchaeota archaeon]